MTTGQDLTDDTRIEPLSRLRPWGSTAVSNEVI